MENFQFHAPRSLDEAISALKSTDEGKFLAGGQSLIPVMKLDMAAYTDLVSLKNLEELKGIRAEGGTLVVGAGSTHAQVAANETVKRTLPALADLASHIGDPQVRNRGTLGGSVAHADPAADYPAAIVALKATLETDRRRISCDDFFTGMFETALEEDEIITKVHFQTPEKAWYAKFANPASKYAIAGVMVAKHGGEVRVAVTGAGPKVFRVPEMEQALAGSFSPSAIEGISVSPEGLNEEREASPEYRAHLIGVMARRAVRNAK
jgi:carbon-monoxide dehydrogenase medium subunit